jgi:hypothetical protein
MFLGGSGNPKGGVSRSRGPQLRRARELPRSCAREKGGEWETASQTQSLGRKSWRMPVSNRRANPREQLFRFRSARVKMRRQFQLTEEAKWHRFGELHQRRAIRVAQKRCDCDPELQPLYRRPFLGGPQFFDRLDSIVWQDRFLVEKLLSLPRSVSRGERSEENIC